MTINSVRFLTSNIIIIALSLSIVMANLIKTQNTIKMDTMDEQVEIVVPLKKQIPAEKITCQIHSTEHRKQEIKFINVGFIAKNKPGFSRTFLCDICLNDYRRRNPTNEDLKKIQRVQKFQYKYIESVLEKYADETISQTTNLLEKAESQLCNDIDSLNQNFNQYCEIYKKNIKEIFQTLRKPCEPTQVKQFIEGKMNQGMIEEFYKNYKTVNKYSVLIGNKNKTVLEGVFQGFQASMEKISKQVKDDMNLSFVVLRKYIEEYDKPKPSTQESGRMIPQNEQKKQAVPTVEEKKPKTNGKVESSLNMNNIFPQRKTSSQAQKQDKQAKHKKEAEDVTKKSKKRVQPLSSCSQSSDESSESEQSSQNLQKRRLAKPTQQKRQKDAHKHKAIQKQNRDKPFKNDRVYMIDEEFMKNSRNRLALYIVVKANTERSGAERVFRMDINDFKRRYPEAFNKYVSIREAGK